MKTKPKEQDIEKAIQHAIFYKFRVTLEKTDAGGRSLRRLNSIPVMLDPPIALLRWFCLPPVVSMGIKVALQFPKYFPDLLGIDKESQRWVFIEVKRPGQKPTFGQSAFLAARLKEGHIAFWADSVGSAIEQYQAAL